MHWRAHQQTTAAQFTTKLAGKAVGNPGAPEVVKQGKTAQADGDGNEQLQGEFQHAAALS